MEHGWVTWCEACDWNVLGPAQREQPKGPVARFLDRAGRTLGARLAAELRGRESLESTLTPAKVAAYAIAVVVEVFALGVIAGAVVLALLTFPNPFGIGGAVVMLGFAYLIRPRLGQAPKDDVVPRSDAPRLYGLVDEAAQTLETKPPDTIVVDHRWNAYWTIVGVRRRRVLGIGLPMLETLPPSQQLALVAHELAHGRNGDVRRSFVIGTALTTLQEMHYALVPGESLLTYSDLGIADHLGRLLMWVLAQPVRGLLLLELHLLLRDMQRAEYLADALAAEVAGTEAVTSLHESMLVSPVLALSMQHASHRRVTAEELFDVLRAYLEAVPERERRRRLRAAALEGTKLGATHPPTAMRINLLHARPHVEPRLLLDPDRARGILHELGAVRPRIAQRLLDRQRDRLYR